MKKTAAKKKAAMPMKKAAAPMNGLTPAQKKLPPFIQKSIMAKKKSSAKKK